MAVLGRAGAIVAFVATVLGWLATAPFAEPSEVRLALLIGNADYVGRLTPSLRYPYQDVQVIRESLSRARFADSNITVVRDGKSREEILSAVSRFANSLRAAGPGAVGFFYYSGHGASSLLGDRRENFLLPTRAPINSSEDISIYGVPLRDIIDRLAAARVKAVFVVVDACRSELAGSKGASDPDKGFVTVPDRSGLFISYATADGASAPDDGAYARALAARIQQPGLTHDRVFELAARDIARLRDTQRLPFHGGTLNADICFVSCEAQSAVGALTAELQAARQQAVEAQRHARKARDMANALLPATEDARRQAREAEAKAKAAQEQARSAAAMAKSGKAGYGTTRLSNGLTYEGEIHGGVATGYGVIRWADGTYEGQVQFGERGQYGVWIHSDGRTSYAGEYRRGIREGYGVYIWNDGSRHEGAFENQMMGGYGATIAARGDVLSGKFSGYRLSGSGVWVSPKVCRYEGEWQEGKAVGYGVYTTADGSVHEGRFVSPVSSVITAEGYGIRVWPDGKRYEGNWSRGERNGLGVLTLADGRVQGGRWQEGELIK